MFQTGQHHERVFEVVAVGLRAQVIRRAVGHHASIGDDDDPVTPPTWGDHVAPHLTNAKHIVVPGAGHITLTRGCVPSIVERFLRQASVDGLDATCTDALTRPPFFVTPTGPAAPPPTP